MVLFSSTPPKIAIFEGLYVLFRELLPRPGQRTEEKPIDDIDVFEYSSHCWAYLITASEVRFVLLAFRPCLDIV